MAQRVKCQPAMPEAQVRSLGRENPMEKGMASHSSAFSWKTPWIEKPGRLQPMGFQSQTEQFQFIYFRSA